MGKWTKLKGKIEKFTPEAPWQEKIDEVKTTFAKLELEDLGAAYKRAKGIVADCKVKIEAENTMIEAISQLLLDRFEANGISSVKLAAGGVLTESPAPYASMKDEDLFLKWLKKKHPKEKLKYPWPSLERLVKHHLDEGIPLPPGVDVFLKNKVKLYAGGSNGEED